ncbi:MAG: sigma-70 family RNA polymerase sigma factor [Tunicatimonas sp.]
MNNDAALVTAVLNGDPHAFYNLVQQHQKLVGHLVSRMVNRTEDCEDICQEVFLRVYQRLPSFRFQSKLSTWIATVAYRTALNYIQKEKKNATEPLEYAAEYPQDLPDAGDQIDQKATHTFIHQQIAQLPVQYRTVLTLFHLEEMSLSEIHEITGMPLGTIKNYLFRARKQLKDKLQQHFLDRELL